MRKTRTLSLPRLHPSARQRSTTSFGRTRLQLPLASDGELRGSLQLPGFPTFVHLSRSPDSQKRSVGPAGLLILSHSQHRGQNGAGGRRERWKER